MRLKPKKERDSSLGAASTQSSEGDGEVGQPQDEPAESKFVKKCNKTCDSSEAKKSSTNEKLLKDMYALKVISKHKILAT